MKFVIYTDGASSGNPGPGGWGAIVIEDNYSDPKSANSFVKEIGGREKNTTNNRMEMKAAIEAIRQTPEKAEIELHTDSEYLMKGITLWIKNWQKNNWRTKNKKPVLNQDLWKELWVNTQNRKVSWKKVLGHSGHKLNDRCDEIATSFALDKNVELKNPPRKNPFD